VADEETTPPEQTPPEEQTPTEPAAEQPEQEAAPKKRSARKPAAKKKPAAEQAEEKAPEEEPEEKPAPRRRAAKKPPAQEPPAQEPAAAEEPSPAEPAPTRVAKRPKADEPGPSSISPHPDEEPAAPALARAQGYRRPVVLARARYVRTSARKARMVCVHLRGKSVQDARAILAFTPRDVARDWSKLLESAVANAENNHELVEDDLIVHEAYADEGPTIKRFRPRAMGRATPIRKRTSHLTLTLTPHTGQDA
jgi:ribosomal protein L22